MNLFSSVALLLLPKDNFSYQIEKVNDETEYLISQMKKKHA